jgi:hypothetical protein
MRTEKNQASSAVSIVVLLVIIALAVLASALIATHVRGLSDLNIFARSPSTSSCGSIQPVTPVTSEVSKMITKIQNNSSFVGLEQGKTYSFYAMYAAQAQYSNGTQSSLVGNYLFVCNEKGISVQVDSQGKISNMSYTSGISQYRYGQV